jgi:predicted nucleotidyltransferase
MFKKYESATRNNDLNTIIKTLSTKNEVDGILLFGSVMTAEFKPYSDIDVAVVLNEAVEPKISSCFSYIENKMADIYFFYSNQIDQLINSAKTLDIYSIEGKLVFWLKNGEILYDKNNRLKRLKDRQIRTEITGSLKYTNWYKINYDYLHNLRMYSSNDALYHQALEIRLLYSMMDLLLYLELRDVPWRGEKAVIRYLEKNNPEFLNKFFECIRAEDLDIKFRLYCELVK